MDQDLTQDEINSLLRRLSEEEIEPDFPSDPSDGEIRNYDFSQQERIVRGRMPGMELIHDRFARSLRNNLANFLSRACFIHSREIEIVKFGYLMKKLPFPSSLHIYRMPPLQGNSLMVISTPLVFSIVEILFGGRGKGKMKVEGREFTAIENRLLGKVALMALETLKEAWSPLHPVDTVYIRAEQNPLTVGVIAPTDLVVVVTLEVEVEEQTGLLFVCTPYSTIEPLREKLATSAQSSQLHPDPEINERMDEAIQKTSVELSVELGRGHLAARDVLRLSVGDIIPLETNGDEEAVVRIEGKPKFTGLIGSYRGRRAVTLTGRSNDGKRK